MAHMIHNEEAIYCGEKAWHRIGQRIPEGSFEEQLQHILERHKVMVSDALMMPIQIMTSDTQLAAALATQYGQAPFEVSRNGTSKTVQIVRHPSQMAIVRQADGLVLPGTVGAGYKLRSAKTIWERAGKFARRIPGSQVSFAAYLHDGSQLIVCLDLGERQINGEAHRRYLTVSGGFDGAKAEELMLSVVRAVCNNTVAMARSDAKSGDLAKAYSKQRHTKNMESRIEQDDAQVASMLEQFGWLEVQLKRFSEVTISTETATKLLDTMLSAAGYKAESKQAVAVKTRMLARYNNPLDDAAQWRGTLNGVWQTYTNEFSNERPGAKLGDSDGFEGLRRKLQYDQGTGAEKIQSGFNLLADFADQALNNQAGSRVM